MRSLSTIGAPSNETGQVGHPPKFWVDGRTADNQVAGPEGTDEAAAPEPGGGGEPAQAPRRRDPSAAARRPCHHRNISSLSDDLPISGAWAVPAAELDERFSRASGPGGQGVNTTDSRVELSYDVLRAPSVPDHLRTRIAGRLSGRLVDGVLTVAATEHRTQLANRRAARERLAQLLREAAVAPAPRRRPTRPTRGSMERRIAEKKRRGQTKRGRQGHFDD